MTEKERNILIQSRTLIFKYGIKSLTMDDISQRLGISKKTLYQFYENKADLISKVVAYTITESQEMMESAMARSNNAIEELYIMYQTSTQIVKRLNPSLDFELRKYYPESFSLLESFRNTFIYNLMVANLEKGIKDKLFREDLSADIIGRIYTLATMEIFNAEIFPPDDYPANHLIKELFTYHIRGIASKKGLDYLENKLKLEE